MTSSSAGGTGFFGVDVAEWARVVDFQPALVEVLVCGSRVGVPLLRHLAGEAGVDFTFRAALLAFLPRPRVDGEYLLACVFVRFAPRYCLLVVTWGTLLGL